MPLPSKVRLFENDVILYGGQTNSVLVDITDRFENDVILYGGQTRCRGRVYCRGFPVYLKSSSRHR